MRTTRMNLQRYMVAVVFLAIALWAGPLVVPEAIRRWKACHVMAVMMETEALSRHAEATRRGARGLADEERMTRRVAVQCEAQAWKYRRALWVPWEFWSLGGDGP